MPAISQLLQHGQEHRELAHGVFAAPKLRDQQTGACGVSWECDVCNFELVQRKAHHLLSVPYSL